MQLSSVFPVGLFGADGPIQSQLDEQLKHGIGHVAALGLIGHKTPEQIAKSVNAALKMMQARATGGDIAMAGVDLGGTPPPEAKAAMAAEMGSVFKTDRRQYMKSN